MTCQNEVAPQHSEELMEIDSADGSSCCITKTCENGLLLQPAKPGDSGEGLPYAPVDWPSSGDVWRWRVGKRVAASGYFSDRYLYLPMRFQRSTQKKDCFKSKLSLEQFVKKNFPGTDVNALFASFSWKVPSDHVHLLKGVHGSFRELSAEMAEQSPSGVAVCLAGNRFCSSLLEEISPYSACDLCCSEPGFCRECCCILCCDTIDLAFGGYSFVRCATIVSNGLICGHAAHLNCALRAYMSGTVGGSIGLDTEYYCRRCDSRTDLTSHVTKLFKSCESIDSREDIEKILGVGYCIVQGSLKKSSQNFLNRIVSALHKLNKGSELKDVWKVEGGMLPAIAAGQMGHLNQKLSDGGDDDLYPGSEYLTLDIEVGNILEEIRKSREQEYRLVEERLLAQKDYIRGLYQQIEKEKAELVQPKPSTDRDSLLSSIKVSEEHVKCELVKLRDMANIGNGLRKMS